MQALGRSRASILFELDGEHSGGGGHGQKVGHGLRQKDGEDLAEQAKTSIAGNRKYHSGEVPGLTNGPAGSIIKI